MLNTRNSCISVGAVLVCLQQSLTPIVAQEVASCMSTNESATAFARTLQVISALSDKVAELENSVVRIDGHASSHFICADGWSSEVDAVYKCTLDVAPPVLQCEAGTVSVQAARNAVSHTLTPADIPRPTIFDTNGDVGSAPDYGGTFVELLQDPTLGQDPVSMITWTRPYFIEGSFAQVRVII